MSASHASASRNGQSSPMPVATQRPVGDASFVPVQWPSGHSDASQRGAGNWFARGWSTASAFIGSNGRRRAAYAAYSGGTT